MQFVITAYDFTDNEALSRRMQHRQAHLQGVQRMISEGSFLSGGAILDAEGRMIGSTVHVAFESRATVEQWIAHDPYTLGRVWERVDIQEVKLVPMNGER